MPGIRSRFAYICAALAVFCFHNSYAQSEGFTSKIYFPGAIGLSIPVKNASGTINNGFMLSTALEYRPSEENHIFYRFNYDAINNHYQQFTAGLPTNVNTGKLSVSLLTIGAGYRRRFKYFRIYGLVQGGLGINNYPMLTSAASNITVSQVSSDHLAIKFSIGAEYYLAKHFALIIEPSYFHLPPDDQIIPINTNNLNLSIGFTTTLF